MNFKWEAMNRGGLISIAYSRSVFVFCDQVIGVGDTGIDNDMCFFFDPAQPMPFNSVQMCSLILQ